MATSKKIMIAVDCQRDFVERGKLAVAGGVSACMHIVGELMTAWYDQVVFTMDYHPADHCSFVDNGGQWPEHCVQHTPGCDVLPELVHACHRNDVPYEFIVKGAHVDRDQYSAFDSKASKWAFNVTRLRHNGCPCEVTLREGVLPIAKDDEVVVCGIAGDVCVLNTLKDLVAAGYKPTVLLAGTASLDGGKALAQYIKKEGLATK